MYKYKPGRKPLGGHRGGSYNWNANRNSQISATPAPELGTLLATIRAQDLETSSNENAQISGCKYVASYNWLNDKGEPTIILPGAPPKWTPPRRGTEMTLKEDSGDYYRDQNGARFPRHPMQPAVEALLASASNDDLSAVDIVACGSTLGNLLRFARGEGRPFRMVVEAVGNTVFFIRRENSPTELIPGVYGFGHAMPEAYTTWDPDVRGSYSHQRIIKYKFASLNCLIRFESDGYLDYLVAKNEDLPTESASTRTSKGTSCDDLLTSALDNSMTISAKASKDTADQLTIKKVANAKVPQEALFDLKTRSCKKMNLDILNEQLPRLWVNQVPHQIVAYHERGLFKVENIRVLDVREDVKKWETENKAGLQKLAVLLRKVLAQAQGQGRMELHLEEHSTELKIRQVGGDFDKCLADEIESRWIAVSSEVDTPKGKLEAEDDLIQL